MTSIHRTLARIMDRRSFIGGSDAKIILGE